MSKLYNKLVKIAYDNPKSRPHLLPLVTKFAGDPEKELKSLKSLAKKMKKFEEGEKKDAASYFDSMSKKWKRHLKKVDKEYQKGLENPDYIKKYTQKGEWDEKSKKKFREHTEADVSFSPSQNSDMWMEALEKMKAKDLSKEDFLKFHEEKYLDQNMKMNLGKSREDLPAMQKKMKRLENKVLKSKGVDMKQEVPNPNPKGRKKTISLKTLQSKYPEQFAKWIKKNTK